MSKQSDALVENLNKVIAKAVIALTLQFDSNLRRQPSAGGTPVDTGHARANWVPSVGAPYTAEASGASAHEAGVAAVISYKLSDGPLFVSNNAPYIGLLNIGSSKQAPAGFIEMAIDEAVAKVQSSFNVDFGSAGGNFDRFVDAQGGRAAEGVAGSYSPFGGD